MAYPGRVEARVIRWLLLAQPYLVGTSLHILFFDIHHPWPIVAPQGHCAVRSRVTSPL